MTTIDANTATAPGDVLAETRQAIDDSLGAFFTAKEHLSEDSVMAEVTAVLRDFLLVGGKRLRPLLCYYGWCAAGGEPMHPTALRAAASLELFHAFALIHDDIIDSAASRRGHPSLHRTMSDRHAGPDDPVAASGFGVNAAILIGDLAMVWSDELLHASGVSAARLAAVRPVLDAMRTELMFGQYLDLLGTGTRSDDVETALTIARYKSGKYTVERPLHVGAAAAGGDARLLDACSAYGVPIGEAFQLRDDVLGIFGDPDVTGKSRLDDLRHGKRTVLLAVALRASDPARHTVLTRLVGDPDLDAEGADTVREIFIETGALAAVEDMIRERLERGLAALESAPFRPAAAASLRTIAHAATARTA